MSFGENLKNLMLDCGFTQTALAQKIGYAQRTVSSWINNQAEPTETAIRKCAEVFEVSTDFLLGLDDFGERVAAPMGDGITSEERELLELFRELSPYLKGLTLDTVRSWASKPGASGLHKKA